MGSNNMDVREFVFNHFFSDLREWSRSNQQVEHVLIEAQRVNCIAQPVVVDLENCFISDSSELEKHDFKAELAASKGMSVLEVEDALRILDSKIEAASGLFVQVEEKVKTKIANLLASQEPAPQDLMYVIIEFWSTYSLSINAYSLLLEVVEHFWDYCSLKMRAYLKVKAQEILDVNYEKIHLKLEDREAIAKGEFAQVGIRLLIGENEEFSLVGDFKKDWMTGEIGLLQSIESYNNYIDAALRFAYSVFGAIARDNNEDDIDETKYLFEISKKNANRLMSALNELEEGGKEMTLKELREEFNFGEEQENQEI
jgi:hypothetical protein